MTRPTKLRYEIELNKPGVPEAVDGAVVRSITADDRDALASLMLDAYVGTIDYEGETLDEAVAEVTSWLEDPLALLDCSYCVQIDGAVVAAVLVSDWEGLPLLGIVMTATAHKQSGLARLVTRSALIRLADVSDRVVLFITEGNTPSERLFASLGAVVVPDPDPSSR